MERQTAKERVLRVPELLSIIFSFLENNELVPCLRVCKAWFDPACDEVWELLSERHSVKGPFTLLTGPQDRDTHGNVGLFSQ